MTAGRNEEGITLWCDMFCFKLFSFQKDPAMIDGLPRLPGQGSRLPSGRRGAAAAVPVRHRGRDLRAQGQGSSQPHLAVQALSFACAETLGQALRFYIPVSTQAHM